MIYQDLSSAKIKTQKRFIKNPRSSISALFRTLRKDRRLSLLGDYPLLAIITNTISEINIPIKKSAVQRVTRQVQELKGQTQLLNQLVNPQQTSKKVVKTVYKTPSTEKMTNSSSRGGNVYEK